MPNEPERQGIPFREFLDKSTNLITIFGVFNALFIYSITIPHKTAASFLLPTFLLLSVLVWLELILYAMNANNGSIKYQLFYFACCTIELGLIIYFSVAFSPLLWMILVFGILMCSTYLLGLLFIKLFGRLLLRKFKIRVQVVSFIVYLIALLISGLLLRLTIPFLAKISENFPTEYILLK